MEWIKLSPFALFKNISFLTIFLSRTSANLADSVYTIALLWIVQTSSGSVTYTGITFAIISFATIFSVAFGPLIDRYSPVLLSSMALLAQGIIVLFIPFFYSIEPNTFILILVFVFLASIFSSLFYPANLTLIPKVLEKKEEIVLGNSFLTSSDQVINIVGFLLGGSLVALIGLNTTFYTAAALLFFACGIYLLFMNKIKLKQKETPATNGKSKYMDEIKEGLRFLYNHAFLRTIMIFSIVANFGLAVLIIILPSIGEAFGSAIYYSLLYVAFFAGMIIGALTSNLVTKSGRNIALAWLGCGITLFFFAYLPEVFAWKASSVVVFGFFMGIIHVLQLSFIQILTPSDMMGRMMSTITTVNNLALPLGAIGGALLTAILPLPIVISIVAVIILICGVSLLLIKVVRNTSIDKEKEEIVESM